jgi:RNA polymerase sigma factor (sigma-70 family)
VKARQHATHHDATLLAHLSIVDSVAKRLAGGRHDFEDLRSVAYLALVRALADFRPERGIALSPYLHLHIRWAILKGLRSDRRLRRADLTSTRASAETSSFSGGSVARWGHGEDELLCREEAALRRRRAAELLEGLSPSERSVVVEHHLRGRELKELVRDGGPSYATIRRRAKSAMEQLRARAAAC